ncbi:hypothetical protein LJC26_06375 [Desulfovibrio sp. OttesenSCG-928-O18]|nr:hypothetical protein [Desulfovibrio sp. OttesenSCG-928-O18]
MSAQQTDFAFQAASTFSVGSVLGRSFAILTRSPVVFCSLALAASVPAIIIDYLGLDGEDIFSISWLLNFMFTLLVEGAIAYAVYRVLTGGSVSVSDALGRGLARLAPLIGACLLATLGVIFGLALFLIPGLILLCMWLVAVPACVVEKLGPIASLNRSADLTMGCRWQVLGLIFLGQFLPAALFAFVGAFLGEISGIHILNVLLPNLFSVLPSAFASVMAATAYYDLRAVKEGLSFDGLTNIFD